jgi:aldose 1-epimerase
MGDTVTLRDSREAVTVSVYLPVNKAYEMVVKGQNVIRKPFADVAAFKASPGGMSGVPLLWPFANRLDEQAFWANGQKYSFDLSLGNTGTGAIPIHGFTHGSTDWTHLETRSDATGAWTTSRLDFYKNPQYMKQFPFANTVTITYRVADGMLEVRTRIDNLSKDPMPVAVGFHPYFQLTDSNREEWTISIGAKTHWLLNDQTIPTGETEPVSKQFRDPKNIPVKDVYLDDIYTDLDRDGQGRGTVSVRGRKQQLDVMIGPNFKTILVLSRVGTPPTPAPGTVAFEPMAGISNSMNLAQKGLYKDLQSVAPGGFWQESFWVRATGF